MAEAKRQRIEKKHLMAKEKLQKSKEEQKRRLLQERK